jgi:hypothetical protein
LDRPKCGFVSQNWPTLAFRIRSSDRLDRLMQAERRTPPTTTMEAIMQQSSWASMLLSLVPARCMKRLMVKSKSCFSGSGPEARPPKVLSMEPLGRTLERSYLGIWPGRAP